MIVVLVVRERYHGTGVEGLSAGEWFKVTLRLSRTLR